MKWGDVIEWLLPLRKEYPETSYEVASIDAVIKYGEIAEKKISLLECRLEIAKTALEKIEDPRKMGHKERDEQTTVYCLQNVAHEALKSIEVSEC